MKPELRFQTYPNNLGETPLWLSLMDHYENITVEYLKNNESAKNLAEIFKHKAKLEEKENPISINEFIKKYHIYDGQDFAHTHAIKRMYASLGISSDNYIPKIILDDCELDWAKNYLSKYPNPIPMCIFSGRNFNNSIALTRMMDFNKWNDIINFLSKNYTCLSVTDDKHHINFNDKLVPVLNLTFRQQAAIFSVCKKTISIESGQSHLALASGATVFRLLFSFGYVNGFLYNNWNYTDDMWKYESRRMFDYLFENHIKVLDNF